MIKYIKKSMEDIGKVLGINQKVYINEPVEELKLCWIFQICNIKLCYCNEFKKAHAVSNIMVDKEDNWFKVYRMLKSHRSVISDIGYWTRMLPPFKE
jgi:hypothetical protein